MNENETSQGDVDEARVNENRGNATRTNENGGNATRVNENAGNATRTNENDWSGAADARGEVSGPGHELPADGIPTATREVFDGPPASQPAPAGEPAPAHSSWPASGQAPPLDTPLDGSPDAGQGVSAGHAQAFHETASAVDDETVGHGHPARFGTILWGVLLLVFSAYMLSTVFMPAWLDPVTWITAGLVLAGVVLVVAGIAAATRRAR